VKKKLERHRGEIQQNRGKKEKIGEKSSAEKVKERDPRLVSSGVLSHSEIGTGE